MKGHNPKSGGRSNSKVKEVPNNPRGLQTPSNSSKLVNKQNKEAPFYTKNAQEVMNKLTDNYKDIKEVNLYFDDGMGTKQNSKRMTKSPSSSTLNQVRPSTPQQRKQQATPDYLNVPYSNNYMNTKPKPKQKPSKRKVFTKENAVLVIQRQFRRYLRVKLF
jgi:hypothetical protein